MSEQIADGTVETPKEDINWEERARKAEAKIVDLKKSSKEQVAEPIKVEESNGMSDEEFNRKIDMRDFLSKNETIKEHSDRFTELVTKGGLTFTGAKAAILAENPEISNQQKTNSMSISGDPIDLSGKSFTQEQVASMPFEERVNVMKKFKSGEITIK